MTLATVCMPWRPQPDRLAAYEHCVNFWNDNGFPVIAADSDPAEWFLCSQARNNAVRQADTPVVIIVDANKFPANMAAVDRAIELAAEGKVCFMCSGGGFIVTSRESFWGIGGFDEDFEPGVWGLDDSAFIHTADTLLDTVRLDGKVCVFGMSASHQSGWRVRISSPTDNPNWSRYVLYETARGNPEAMRELVNNNQHLRPAGVKGH
jgi:hypothetical protein